MAKTKRTRRPAPEGYLTVAEIGEAVGWAPRTVQARIAAGDLRGVRMGRWLVKREDFEAWRARAFGAAKGGAA